MTVVDHMPAPQENSAPRSIVPLLQALVACGGSDLHVKAGAAPRVRIDGALRELEFPQLRPNDTSSCLTRSCELTC